jgi:hypothetical protein
MCEFSNSLLNIREISWLKLAGLKQNRGPGGGGCPVNVYSDNLTFFRYGAVVSKSRSVYTVPRGLCSLSDCDEAAHVTRVDAATSRRRRSENTQH